jgi:hypothetical protein
MNQGNRCYHANLSILAATLVVGAHMAVSAWVASDGDCGYSPLSVTDFKVVKQTTVTCCYGSLYWYVAMNTDVPAAAVVITVHMTGWHNWQDEQTACNRV